MVMWLAPLTVTALLVAVLLAIAAPPLDRRHIEGFMEAPRSMFNRSRRALLQHVGSVTGTITAYRDRHTHAVRKRDFRARHAS